MSGPAGCRDHQPRGTRAQADDSIRRNTRSPERDRESRAFLLTKTFMDAGHPGNTCRRAQGSVLLCSWNNTSAQFMGRQSFISQRLLTSAHFSSRAVCSTQLVFFIGKTLRSHGRGSCRRLTFTVVQNTLGPIIYGWYYLLEVTTSLPVPCSGAIDVNPYRRCQAGWSLSKMHSHCHSE